MVAVYRRLDATDSDLEQVDVLAEAFAEADEETLPLVVGTVLGTVFAPWEDGDLGVSSSLTVDAVAKATGLDTDRIESVWTDTGDLGDAAAWAVEHETQRTLFSEPLTLERVHDTLRSLADLDGEGSQSRRVEAVAGLLADADPEAARYVVRTALGHMRLGVGEGAVRDAIAQAFLDGESEAVERAYQVTNDYRLVAETARDGGLAELRDLGIELFRPVKVMLAKKAEGLDTGIESVAEGSDDVLLEYKYDGARVQIHVEGDEVRVFTRRLEDVTAQFPDVVETVRERVTAERCLLDGELVGYDPETGDAVPFQQFSRRIKRKYDIRKLAEEIPVTVYLFDLLYHEGESLVDDPLDARLDRLERCFEPADRDIERAETADPDDLAAARAFYQSALSAGHEGVMLKNRTATYQPGSRVGYMMKHKPVMEPLDLVVTRATWSEGRRSDLLGRLYLACRDGDDYREVGRLSTGYTDEELEALTERLTDLVVAEDGRTVELRPELVVEAEYEEIQTSPEYGSGYALRFPRFLDTRDDLDPEGADTLDRVESLFEAQ